MKYSCINIQLNYREAELEKKNFNCSQESERCSINEWIDSQKKNYKYYDFSLIPIDGIKFTCMFIKHMQVYI